MARRDIREGIEVEDAGLDLRTRAAADGNAVARTVWPVTGGCKGRELVERRKFAGKMEGVWKMGGAGKEEGR